jgi:(p)ppGpp synthase/HD superfamily hydrolase
MINALSDAQLIEWSQELQEPGESHHLKVDLAPNEVYAFTPKGASELPAAFSGFRLRRPY